MTDNDWRHVRFLAGVRPPSAKGERQMGVGSATRKLVRDLMWERFIDRDTRRVSA